MNKRINRIVLWFCTGVLSLVLVGVMVSCDPDDGGSGTGGGSTVTYYDVGDDCGVIEASKQHIPKDTAELKRLIERDITQQGNTVNLNYIDTSAITDMSSLFETEEGATFNGAIHCWDVSKVTTMSAMFKDATAFNQDISSWDVGAVTTMESMFEGAEVFEADLTAWSEHVLQTVNTASMFAGANKIKKVPNWKEAGICFAPTAHVNVMENKAKLVEKLNELITASTPSPDLNHLETCHVKDMSELFKSKATFNGDISQWDVSNVENMAGIFEGAELFDQDISGWIVNRVTTMSAMFKGAKAFNRDISGWDIGAVTTMESMFEGAEAFEADLTAWGEHVQSTVNTASMFANAPKVVAIPNWKEAGVCFAPTAHASVMENKAKLVEKLNELITASTPSPDLNHLETCHVKDMSGLFSGKATFKGDISQWDVSKVENMAGIFEGAELFDQDISGWIVNRVTTMSAMFKGAKAFNRDISGWDVGAVTTMESMFEGAEAFEADLTAWSEHVQSTVNTASMFANAPKVVAIPNWKEAGICFAPTAHVNVMKDTAELKEIVDAEITKDPNVNLNHLETCNVTNMDELFKGKTTFNGDISQWDVSNVTTMRRIFNEAKAFNKPIGDWQVDKLQDMYAMFSKAIVFDQPIANWNVSMVKNMNSTFNTAEAFNQDISKWNVSSVTSMSYMFYDAKKFCQDLDSWSVTGVERKTDTFVGTASDYSEGECGVIPPSWY